MGGQVLTRLGYRVLGPGRIVGLVRRGGLFLFVKRDIFVSMA